MMLLGMKLGGGGSFMKTPKKRVMVSTVFGEEEEVPPPAVGMVFGSWDELDSYFWRFDRQKEFGIVRAASGWIKMKKDMGDGKCCKEKRNAKWTCECYGRPSRNRKVDALREGLEQDGDTLVKRKTKKCKCLVELYASVNEEGNWVVRKLKLEHDGHIVTPRKFKDVSMYRKHELMVKYKHLVNQTCVARKSRVKVSQIYSYFA
ncbi:uncharacterized protein LOC110697887 isoform X1 [Chenopodium quinoa]|uniref:uncharacterized protein LOC110697887 isoform X1 n=1 Tax=Chenopodium quinoa TaxID=63459 RepID=UPI000B7703F0|nr:uncharacterized protein LOC110697887 isoform X1 [Chenopodium quinoa]